jgi:hypothetical protein
VPYHYPEVFQFFILTIRTRFLPLSFFFENHQWWYRGFGTAVVLPPDLGLQEGMISAKRRKYSGILLLME